MCTTQQVTVFVVDVENIRRSFVDARILNPIAIASDGEQAVGMLRRGEIPRPFIVLLDLNMPRMNGLEFLKVIRGDPKLRDAVVFVLTTSKRDEDRVASYDIGVAGYILKERAGADFLDLTAMLHAYWRVVELPE